MTTDITGQKVTMNAPFGGYVTADTSRLPGDYTIEERAQWIAEKHGAEAAAIVVALSRELNIGLQSTYELALAGDPAFRKACERHLVALRKRAAEDREERKRQQEIADREHRRRSLTGHIQGTAQLLGSLRAQREHVRFYARAEGRTISAESAAVEDAEIDRLTAQLERLQGELKEFEESLAGGVQ